MSGKDLEGSLHLDITIASCGVIETAPDAVKFYSLSCARAKPLLE